MWRLQIWNVTRFRVTAGGLVVPDPMGLWCLQ